MIIFILSFIATIAFMGSVAEFEKKNKDFAHHLTCICCAAIIAIAIIKVFS